jgi:endoglucanase
MRWLAALSVVVGTLVLVPVFGGCQWLENPPPQAEAAPTGPVGTPKLLRGFNLGNALDAPTEGAWGVVLEESDFTRLRAEGFDHVRLPVRFSAHASTDPPYTIEDEFFARVDWALRQALLNNLAVVLDFHHYEELMKDPDGHAARFVGLWRQIAGRYRNVPEAVCFELLNEPHDKLNATKWNSLMASALRAVRETNPKRTVILEGVDWASAKNLRDTLSVPDDPAVVGSFHMYQPILFTHQGATWMAPEFHSTGVVFPGPPQTTLRPDPAAESVSWTRDWFDRYNREALGSNPSGPSAVAEQLDMAMAFAQSHHLPVYMGEFAAIDIADMASRSRWTRMVRVEAEKRGFGWAYWDDGGSFEAYDRKSGRWLPELLAALKQ